MIRTTMIRIMMIRNSMISIVSLLILVLWPFRVLIYGLFTNDKHSFYERYSSTDTRYLSTDGQLVGPSAWLQSIPSIPVCLPLHRLFHTVSHTQTLHKLSIITYWQPMCSMPNGATPGTGWGSASWWVCIGLPLTSGASPFLPKHFVHNPTVFVGKLRVSLQLVPIRGYLCSWETAANLPN